MQTPSVATRRQDHRPHVSFAIRSLEPRARLTSRVAGQSLPRRAPVAPPPRPLATRVFIFDVPNARWMRIGGSGFAVWVSALAACGVWSRASGIEKADGTV